IIRSGQLGRIIAARSVFTTRGHNLPAWKQSRVTGGGALLDLASHHIDLFCFLLGSTAVEAQADIQSIRFQADTASLRLRLDNGAAIDSFFSLSCADDDRLEI